MKIFGNRIENILNIYRNNGNTKKVNKAQQSKKPDQVNISNMARDCQFAKNEVKKLPDIRTEKVEEIKRQIQTGTYEINADKIAEKIVESSKIDIKL
ncbi:negative regulator of flagellin synthesis, anti-sigma-28 factor FlgM [Gottschalkia acidurici 9a]|uniref:Negative regulator of flagellin synthesis n=1 Tax=Gottschalkia acidurici (strain ATCC 7906 / DSM 604 / BCRC 14475 / CIP 104303 / KCTC 5404 / NCIMB 10678 / 9a) TaxID=1128398 RepID=K0AVL4_GOTA9|nr:flagellar biosynthesis anti-sigma factor FlgM [Gottschalkia acidurici]AFS77319.1 negative regulator of flagellin synthesis, anti-sigma-28 factor FlgM [Gottschalkia acidurici 9a]